MHPRNISYERITNLHILQRFTSWSTLNPELVCTRSKKTYLSKSNLEVHPEFYPLRFIAIFWFIRAAWFCCLLKAPVMHRVISLFDKAHTAACMVFRQKYTNHDVWWLLILMEWLKPPHSESVPHVKLYGVIIADRNKSIMNNALHLVHHLLRRALDLPAETLSSRPVGIPPLPTIQKYVAWKLVDSEDHITTALSVGREWNPTIHPW